MSFESVLHDQHERDARDAARAIAPDEAGAEAVVIDTTGMSVEDVVERMAREIDRSSCRVRGQRTEPRARFPHDEPAIGG